MSLLNKKSAKYSFKTGDKLTFKDEDTIFTLGVFVKNKIRAYWTNEKGERFSVEVSAEDLERDYHMYNTCTCPEVTVDNSIDFMSPHSVADEFVQTTYVKCTCNERN